MAARLPATQDRFDEIRRQQGQPQNAPEDGAQVSGYHADSRKP